MTTASHNFTTRLLIDAGAKSGSLAKLAIGDDVRLVRKTAVVMRPNESNGYAQEVPVMVCPAPDSFCRPMGNGEERHSSCPGTAKRPEHAKYARVDFADPVLSAGPCLFD